MRFCLIHIIVVTSTVLLFFAFVTFGFIGSLQHSKNDDSVHQGHFSGGGGSNNVMYDYSDYIYFKDIKSTTYNEISSSAMISHSVANTTKKIKLRDKSGGGVLQYMLRKNRMVCKANIGSHKSVIEQMEIESSVFMSNIIERYVKNSMYYRDCVNYHTVTYHSPVLQMEYIFNSTIFKKFTSILLENSKDVQSFDLVYVRTTMNWLVRLGSHHSLPFKYDIGIFSNNTVINWNVNDLWVEHYDNDKFYSGAKSFLSFICNHFNVHVIDNLFRDILFDSRDVGIINGICENNDPDTNTNSIRNKIVSKWYIINMIIKKRFSNVKISKPSVSHTFTINRSYGIDAVAVVVDDKNIETLPDLHQLFIHETFKLLATDVLNGNINITTVTININPQLFDIIEIVSHYNRNFYSSGFLNQKKYGLFINFYFIFILFDKLNRETGLLKFDKSDQIDVGRSCSTQFIQLFPLYTCGRIKATMKQYGTFERSTRHWVQSLKDKILKMYTRDLVFDESERLEFYTSIDKNVLWNIGKCKFVSSSGIGSRSFAALKQHEMSIIHEMNSYDVNYIGDGSLYVNWTSVLYTNRNRYMERRWDSKWLHNSGLFSFYYENMISNYMPFNAWFDPTIESIVVPVGLFMYSKALYQSINTTVSIVIGHEYFHAIKYMIEKHPEVFNESHVMKFKASIAGVSLCISSNYNNITLDLIDFIVGGGNNRPDKSINPFHIQHIGLMELNLRLLYSGMTMKSLTDGMLARFNIKQNVLVDSLEEDIADHFSIRYITELFDDSKNLKSRSLLTRYMLFWCKPNQLNYWDNFETNVLREMIDYCSSKDEHSFSLIRSVGPFVHTHMNTRDVSRFQNCWNKF
jgi:hypothetical protein